MDYLDRLTFGRVIFRADMRHDEVIFQMSESGLSCINFPSSKNKENGEWRPESKQKNQIKSRYLVYL